MWVGWNAVLSQNTLDGDRQKVWYLPQINLLPTSNAVVVETLKISLSIANECGRKTIAVTYDFAITKLALQIQHEEKPTFDRVFIALGSFHIEMAFFSALGKIIAESGGPHILNESEVLATGSLKSFHKGKNYNRCKKMHELLALALESVHYEEFFSQGNREELVAGVRKDLVKMKLEKCSSEQVFSKEVDDVLYVYKCFCGATAEGKHGKTAQFWILYVNWIHLYHDFIRSIRIGDLELYISCFPKIIDLFFAMNHPNYASWAVRYYENLINLPKTHPEVFDDFEKGWFAIKRTEKPFSATPIDLTLEQTINADAVNQKIEISSMTNSISARQRWSESHYLRTAIISDVYEELGMTKKDDLTKDLKTYKVKKDSADFQKVRTMIRDTMNPFDNNIGQEYLFNLGTGKAASKETETFLLNMESIGEEERKRFVSECIENEEMKSQLRDKRLEHLQHRQANVKCKGLMEK